MIIVIKNDSAIQIFILTILLFNFVKASIKDFKLIFEKMEIGFQDPKILYENVTCRKYNRTTVTTTTYEELFEPMLDGQITVQVRGYQFLSNVYRLTSVQFDYDYCSVLYLGSFGTKEFKANSNYPPICPIPRGKYYIKDGVVSTDLTKYFNHITSMPPNFCGKWKLSMSYLIKGKRFLTYDWYGEIKKKVKW